jgi:hypothetical protein
MIDEFNRKCGEILRMALHVETTIDFFLANYFCFPQDYRTFILEDEFVDMNFERKIQIFDKICERENIDKKRVEMIDKAVRFVKDVRNRVAHGEAYQFSQNEEPVLQKRKSAIYKKDELKLTDELINEVDEKRLFSIQEIVKVHIELSEKFKS